LSLSGNDDVERGAFLMRVAIFGTGAIGCYLGVKLHLAGSAKVTFIARGPQRDAMRQNGLSLISNGDEVRIDPTCTDDPRHAGPQDCVIVTVKSYGLPEAAPHIAQLMTPDTTVLIAQNGLPYWYFYELDSAWRNHRIESVDPGGRLWETLPPSQVVGSVVYPAAAVIEPGVVKHTHGNQITLGEPNGSLSVRIRRLASLLEEAGLKAPIRTDIREEVWQKLLGNLSFNPLSALTGSTLERMAGRADLQNVARAMMEEAQRVALCIGLKQAIDIDKRIEEARNVGPHKTSMLQDLERGRPLEIDGLLGAVVELGRLTGQSMPVCAMMLAMIRERARQNGCYPLD
jgi:2-dehydropantoate 2-reductase